MAEEGALATAQGSEEAPLDAAAIRSRVEELSRKRRRGGVVEEEEAEVADAEVALVLDSAYQVSASSLIRVGWCQNDIVVLDSAYQVAEEGMGVPELSTAAIVIDDLDAHLERLRKEVSLADEENRKVSDEINVTAETTANDMIRLDVGTEVLECLLSKLESKGFTHSEASPAPWQSDSTDSCRNQTVTYKDCIYEVLELDQQIGKSKMNLKMLQSLQSVDETWQLKSMLLPFEVKVLDFKDNSLKMFLKAPTLTSGCVLYGQTMDCAIDSFVSDHELLIEVDEGNMEPKNVKIFPDDVCVDILIEKLKSSREVIPSPSLGWLIQQCQCCFIINALRRSLVNDANNSRHSFEYFDKEEAIVAHMDRGIDASIKISSDWPLCSYGLKLVSLRNSGTHPTNMASSLLSKTKELANGLDLHIRQHLVRFVDAVEEILIRELRSG